MPRITTKSADALDFCNAHMPSVYDAEVRFRYRGQPGPDGRGNCFEYDPEHPDYGQDEYHCHRCGTLLNSSDN